MANSIISAHEHPCRGCRGVMLIEVAISMTIIMVAALAALSLTGRAIRVIGRTPKITTRECKTIACSHTQFSSKCSCGTRYAAYIIH